MVGRKIRVLIVDDSALVRQVLEAGLRADPEIEVVGTAGDPYAARDKIMSLKPDVLTLDVEMPRMDGIDFLRKLMPQYPMPVVMVSSLTERGKAATIDALEAGAVDFVTKPTSDIQGGLVKMMGDLRAKIKIASRARVEHFRGKKVEFAATATKRRALETSTDKVIALGASTGGTEAIKDVLSRFPLGCPGIVIVQHMPPKFTEMYAERLDRTCDIEVREARDGDRVVRGRALLAPGGVQMRIVRSGGEYRVKCGGTEKVSGHCPSVDVLFQSVAEEVGKNAVGVIMTGMGSDGSKGLLAMRSAGAPTVGQDEATSVIYGMPKVAFDLGAVQVQKPLSDIAKTALDLMSK
jgi:two-component system, chemotaxis family, protein-glutamate methylesterase/glutaminase